MKNLNLIVVTLVNNDAELYKATRRSLNSKKTNEIFHLVVDSSEIPILDIIPERDPDLKVLRLPPVGIYPTMNFALNWITENIKGDPYVQFLNSGDQYCRDFIFAELDLADLDKKVIYFPYYILDHKTSLQRLVDPINWNKQHQFFAYRAICHQAILLRLSIFKHHGVFDTQYKIAADWDHIIRISQSETFHYKKEPIINFSLGGYSSLNKKIAIKELFSLRKKYGPRSLTFNLLSICFQALQKCRLFLISHFFERFDSLVKSVRIFKGWNAIKS